MHTSSIRLSATSGDDVRRAREAALGYWAGLGWPVRVTGDGVYLSIESGRCAIAAPAGVGERILAALRSAGHTGVVLQHPGPGQNWWIFPVEGDDAAAAVLWRRDLNLLRPGADIALPPTRYPAGPVTWMSPPAEGEPSHWSAAAFQQAVARLSRVQSMAPAPTIRFRRSAAA